MCVCAPESIGLSACSRNKLNIRDMKFKNEISYRHLELKFSPGPMSEEVRLKG